MTIKSSFFEIQSLEANDGTLLVMSKNRLTEDENLEQLDRDFMTLTDTFHVRRIILDLTSVTYMTSAAIGKLISLHRRLTRNEGRLVLCSLQPEVQSTLKTSHLLTYFRVADSSSAASELFA
ncbi:STAS domain-containing protein [Planctomicrobium sp. SH661]|uniref:STAS domain-containing protein n=1 Tax=Planctomicrobium sp. SH661 TaxID=3448124 RepID=UPI003F5CB863